MAITTAQAQPLDMSKPAAVREPPGPFSSWPADKRDAAIEGVKARCRVLGIMVFDGAKSNDHGVGEDAAAMMTYCTARMMPDDWPDRQANIDAAEAHYREAIRLNPKLPDPHFLDKAIPRNENGAIILNGPLSR